MEQSELKYFEHCIYISSSHDTLVSIVKQTGVEKLKIFAYQLLLALVSLYLALFSVSEDRIDVHEGVFLGSAFFPLFLAAEPPDDPRIGFLPPNNGTTGQGFVTFTVGLKNLLPLTRIDAQANIYFDKNEPIETPPIFNTVRKTTLN